jgi:hypothetical protein
MALDPTQPVYPPVFEGPITSQWGRAVADSVTQRFASDADRDAKWTTPPRGSRCMTTDNLYEYVHNGTRWVRQATPRSSETQVDYALSSGHASNAGSFEKPGTKTFANFGVPVLDAAMTMLDSGLYFLECQLNGSSTGTGYLSVFADVGGTNRALGTIGKVADVTNFSVIGRTVFTAALGQPVQLRFSWQSVSGPVNLTGSLRLARILPDYTLAP